MKKILSKFHLGKEDMRQVIGAGIEVVRRDFVPDDYPYPKPATEPDPDPWNGSRR